MKWHCIVNIPETWVFGEKVENEIIKRQSQVTYLSEDKWGVVVGHFGTSEKTKELAIKKADKLIRLKNE